MLKLPKIKDKLEFRANDNSKSIGECLLHIAAFEYLVAGAAAAKIGSDIDLKLWDRLKGGFNREAGFPRAVPESSDSYVELLDKTREITMSLADRVVAIEDKDFDDFVNKLSIRDTANNDLYEKLKIEARLSMMLHASKGTLSIMLQSHESYHRGQIFFQRHLAG
jgi:hypothetical protein